MSFIAHTSLAVCPTSVLHNSSHESSCWTDASAKARDFNSQIHVNGEVNMQRMEEAPGQLLKKESPRSETLLNQFIGVVICMNAITVGIELDYGPDGDEPMSNRIPWFLVESLFIIIFIVEIGVRICWEKYEWPKSVWNWLDFVIISLAVLETFVLSFIAGKDNNLQMLTLLRIVRLFRLARMLRLMRMFQSFYITLLAFRSALMSILSISALTFCGIYFCAIFTTATIGRNEQFLELRLGRYTGKDFFGTVPRSMYSLFELMTLEGWEDVGRPMVETTPYMAVFLFVFIMVFTFGLLNMIVAMVVDRTLMQSRLAQETSEEEELEYMTNVLSCLKTTFKEIDFDKSGMVSKEELESALVTNEIVKTSLNRLDIPSADVFALYQILDANGDNEVSLEEFVNGCARLRGAYRTDWDILALRAYTKSIQGQMTSLRSWFHGNMESCEASCSTSSDAAARGSCREVARSHRDPSAGGSDESVVVANVGETDGGDARAVDVGSSSWRSCGNSLTCGEDGTACAELLRRLDNHASKREEMGHCLEAESAMRVAEHTALLERLEVESMARAREHKELLQRLERQSKARAADHEELLQFLKTVRAETLPVTAGAQEGLAGFVSAAVARSRGCIAEHSGEMDARASIPS
eukprot:TRINITY_DN7790_c0_g1_i1.p1 TRINITY_DN7790_c0_g1~~TRINITY_DN7790_c0_g1_i1.p1  ORF type:complete len:641 (+),score=124.87 TRINITY_DN7790_c0_g1_i1:101-2023(+)